MSGRSGFWGKVEERNGCQEWMGCRNRAGYGLVQRAGRTWKAHRYAWFLTHGPIPRRAMVLHRCDNRSCVNPDHLYLGDQSANMQDRIERNPASILHGVRHGMARLSEPEVQAIRQRYDAGESPYLIAADYPVKFGAISAIGLRRNWKTLPELEALNVC